MRLPRTIALVSCCLGLLVGGVIGCQNGGINPVLEQYHQGATSPWQAYLQFQNFCPDDLWHSSQPCPSGNCTGALSTDTFDIDIRSSDDRDQIYFFEEGFEPRGPGISSGRYGILFGDDMWTAQNPFENDPDKRVMSIRYYDRGGCSATVPFGNVRRKFLKNTHKEIKGKDIYGSVVQSLNTDRCGDPYVNADDDYISFERLFERKLATLIFPFVTTFDIQMDGGWRFATGRQCVDTRLAGNKQGNYVRDTNCSGTDPDFEWRWNQLKLEDVAINWYLASTWVCNIDLLCSIEWWVIYWMLQNAFDTVTFTKSLENGFHDAMWSDNPQFKDHSFCQSASDCVEDPVFSFNYNDMLFDVRCKDNYRLPEPPECDDSTVPHKVPDQSNGCQLRPSRVTRVNLHPDRFEVIFLERNEGLGNYTTSGLDGYRFLLTNAQQCLSHDDDSHTGDAGTGLVANEWSCGNNIQELFEQCDGSTSRTCADEFGPGASGEVKCSSWCQFDYSECCVPVGEPAVAGKAPKATRMPPK